MLPGLQVGAVGAVEVLELERRVWTGEGGYDSSFASSVSNSAPRANLIRPLSAWLAPVRPATGCRSWAQEAGSSLTGCASAARGRRAGRRAGEEAGTTPGGSWRGARWERRGYPAGWAGGLCPELGAAALRLSRPGLRLRGSRNGGGGEAVNDR